jgi:hypothetical protein
VVFPIYHGICPKKLGCQDIPKILLKVVLNTINQSINHVEREVGNGLQYSVDGK